MFSDFDLLDAIALAGTLVLSMGFAFGSLALIVPGAIWTAYALWPAFVRVWRDK